MHVFSGFFCLGLRLWHCCCCAGAGRETSHSPAEPNHGAACEAWVRQAVRGTACGEVAEHVSGRARSGGGNSRRGEGHSMGVGRSMHEGTANTP